MHIAIGGNIGSGKTSLTELLAKNYNWKPHYENVDDNPYIIDFYEDMQRWSFHMQVYFVQNRFKQVVEIRKSGETVVQDRTIYEDAYIFAPNLHDMGLMSSRDFESYSSLFSLMSSLIQPPDLLIIYAPLFLPWYSKYRSGAVSTKHRSASITYNGLMSVMKPGLKTTS